MDFYLLVNDKRFFPTEEGEYKECHRHRYIVDDASRSTTRASMLLLFLLDIKSLFLQKDID